MTTGNISFEEAVHQLMELAIKEEEAVSSENQLNDEEKQQIIFMLAGYKKALQDILTVCLPQDNGEQSD